MTSPGFRLSRNPFGRLVLELPDGSVHEAVVPVRAFPIGAPDEGQCGETLCADGEGCAPVACGDPPTPKGGCTEVPGAPLAVLALLLLEQRVRRRQQLGL